MKTEPHSDFFDSLADIWVDSRRRIETSDIINRKLLLQTLADKSFWLAPKPMAFYIIFAIIFIFGLSYCLTFRPGYWPVPALCIFGAADTAWQTVIRDRIRRIDGGLIGMQRNLNLYRRLYIWLSIVMWLIMIPFLWWFGNFFELYSDPATAIVCISLLATACIVVFIIRTYKTFRALGDLDAFASELKELQ